MQLICVDEQNFAKLRTKGGVYVDKTKAMYDLFKDGTYFFIARPRRFGKSLLCSTLAELFTGNRDLFKNTWIESSDWEWKKHPVLHFDMTNAISSTGDAKEVRKGLVRLLTNFAQDFGLSNFHEEEPHLMLAQLIKKIHAKTGEQVIVIIDEYDKPLLDAINKTDTYQAIHEELRIFYSPLKALSAQLRLVFMTGVFKFAKTSIFSGLNNLNDITFDPMAACIAGYTEQEIRTFFTEHLNALAKKNGLSVDEMVSVMRTKYNGYTFGLDTDAVTLSEKVYNPFALNYVFKTQQQLNKWFESGSPSALIKILVANNFKDLAAQDLTVSLNRLSASCGPESMVPLYMLYYAGYLTILNYAKDKVSLGFPNLEVSQAFSDVLAPHILEKSIGETSRVMDDLHDIFAQERLDDLKDLLNEALAPVAYPVLSKPKNAKLAPPQEHVYQVGFYYLFIGSKMMTSLEDMTNRGRIDIVVNAPTAVYIFELKMDEPAAVAMQQIKDKEYPLKFKKSGKKVFAIGISVSSKKRVVKEITWEQL